MLIIKKLSCMIEDELNDAERYIDNALKEKEERPELARLFANLSNQEMEHMRMLHEAVTEMIDQYRQKNGEPPEAMMAVYNYLHEKNIDHSAKIRVMQNLFKS